MKIDTLNFDPAADRPRISARITWEDSDKPAQTIYFETDRQFTDALACRPDAFLAAALTPALWSGERRIRVEGEVCPELIENLRVATRFFQHWFALPKGNAVIEAKPRALAQERPDSKNAAFFFSGGIDSLSTLRANRLHYPAGHPGSIKDGLIIFGLEVEDPAAFTHVVQSLLEISRAADVTLIPVATNVRALNDDWIFWYKAYMGPALCAVAHAFGRRVGSAVVASDYDVPHLLPHGSHPLVEPNFGGYELRIRYDGITRTRLEKTRLVAEWPAALQNLRVCNKPEHYQARRLNCGECEKCLRTMLALIALGALGKTQAFPCADVSSETVLAKVHLHPKILLYYEELVGPLGAVGRLDLAGALQQLLERARGETGWRGRLRKYDRERLNGGLGALKRAIAPSSVPAVAVGVPP